MDKREDSGERIEITDLLLLVIIAGCAAAITMMAIQKAAPAIDSYVQDKVKEEARKKEWPFYLAD